MRIIVTGSAGFIGFSLARQLLSSGHEVLGIDCMTPYYDVALKRARLRILLEDKRYRHLHLDVADSNVIEAFAAFRPEIVLHFAAQAGVRYSIDHPECYVGSNIVGTFNILEACRAFPVAHLLVASTSSVYGGNERMPFSETDKADLPLTLYAATKKSCEALGHAYAHLFAIPTTALRFFTVYGPWGRPDMALFKFTRAIIEGEPVELYNGGRMTRDFTYIDDLTAAIVALIGHAPGGDPVGPHDTLSPVAPYRVVNIGGGNPVQLGRFVDVIEEAVGRPAERVLRPMQEGDVPHTCSATTLLESLIGRPPSTPIEVGVPRFVEWYRSYIAEHEPKRVAAGEPALAVLDGADA